MNEEATQPEAPRLRFHADSAYVIGADHSVCQDYSAVKNDDDRAVAILSDGCSGSKDTDFGSRILTRTALGPLRELLHASSLYTNVEQEVAEASRKLFYQIVIDRASRTCKNLDMPLECLDATLLTLSASEDSWTAMMYGDGVMAFGKEDGTLEILSCDFDRSYPRYLSYLTSLERLDAFNAVDGNTQRLRSTTISPSDQVRSDTIITNQEYSYSSGKSSEYKFIAVMSDGVKSFTDSQGDPVPWVQVVHELCSFKNWEGEFARRRLNGFLKKSRKAGWRHDDDLSIAAIAIAKIPQNDPEKSLLEL